MLPIFAQYTIYEDDQHVYCFHYRLSDLRCCTFQTASKVWQQTWRFEIRKQSRSSVPVSQRQVSSARCKRVHVVSQIPWLQTQERRVRVAGLGLHGQPLLSCFHMFEFESLRHPVMSWSLPPVQPRMELHERRASCAAASLRRPPRKRDPLLPEAPTSSKPAFLHPHMYAYMLFNPLLSYLSVGFQG